MADHLLVLLGQSNANGSNTDFDPDGVDRRDPRILTLPASGAQAGALVPAREPLAPAGAHPPGGMGPAGPFAALLLPTLPPEDRLVIVPVTMGGTGMRRHGSYPGVWLPGLEEAGRPHLFARAVDHIRLALALCEMPTVTAVLWHQGESDGGRTEAEYAEDLDLLIGSLRAQIPECAGAPFLVGQMARERLLAFPDHHGVHAALRHTPRRMARTGYAEAPPIGHVNDACTHFTAAGQRLLAANYYRAYRAVLAREIDDGAGARTGGR